MRVVRALMSSGHEGFSVELCWENGKPHTIHYWTTLDEALRDAQKYFSITEEEEEG